MDQQSLKQSQNWFPIFQSVLYFVVLTVIASFWIGVIQNRDGIEKSEQTKKILSGLVSSLGTISWPIIWRMAIGGDSTIKNNVAVLPGLVWPLVMGMVDMQKLSTIGITQNVVDTEENRNQRDANSIIALVFALGIFTSAHMETIDTKRQIVPMLLYALVICVAFVIPSFSFDPQSIQQHVFRSVQRVGLNWATGFVITSIIELLLFKNQTRINK